MEVNKDEAQRCVDIAIDAMRDNNLQRAEKFLTKSNNLFPTQKARGNQTSSHRKKKTYTDCFYFYFFL